MSGGQPMPVEEWDALVQKFALALRLRGMTAVTVIAKDDGNTGHAFVSLPKFKDDDERNPGVLYWNLWSDLTEMHRKALEMTTRDLVSGWEQRILAKEASAQKGENHE